MLADLALMEGKILTMNPSQPCAEAVAIKRDKIIKVGANEEIVQLVGRKTRVIRLDGKTVVPGFIDTHIHVADFGRLLTWVDLRGAKSIREMQTRILEHARAVPAKRWIIGRGWDQNCFAELRLPTRYDLDEASPDNPVVLYHENGKLCVVNSKALEIAGINVDTRNPPDGVIDKQAADEPTGVLRNAATNLIWRVVPAPSEDELADAAARACKKVAEAGVTTVHWMVLYPAELSVIHKLYKAGKLPFRVYVIVPSQLFDDLAVSTLSSELGNAFMKVGGVEISADGYLAARTAALSKPYGDCPSSSGQLLCSIDEMHTLSAKIRGANLQLVIHAVGDRAVDAALTVIESPSEGFVKNDPRIRIEQAAVLNQELIARMANQKVVVSVQPCVVGSEFSVWSATERLGMERARWLFPLKTLLKTGVKVVAGSDCPMEPLSPLGGIQAAVAREFFPEEGVTVDEALRMYTVDAAYASFEETVKGSIEVGKLADIAVLSCDPHDVPPNEIGQISVDLTVVGGRVVYSKR
ncbi:MAG: amidohydrolase [Candidatus Bathyarchaeota archaeon]|nr:amidohydrolase [Candidatus Bathyarchaeota archaeon]